MFSNSNAKYSPYNQNVNPQPKPKGKGKSRAATQTEYAEAQQALRKAGCNHESTLSQLTWMTKQQSQRLLDIHTTVKSQLGKYKLRQELLQQSIDDYRATLEKDKIEHIIQVSSQEKTISDLRLSQLSFLTPALIDKIILEQFQSRYVIDDAVSEINTISSIETKNQCISEKKHDQTKGKDEEEKENMTIMLDNFQYQLESLCMVETYQKPIFDFEFAKMEHKNTLSDQKLEILEESLKLPEPCSTSQRTGVSLMLWDLMSTFHTLFRFNKSGCTYEDVLNSFTNEDPVSNMLFGCILIRLLELLQSENPCYAWSELVPRLECKEFDINEVKNMPSAEAEDLEKPTKRSKKTKTSRKTKKKKSKSKKKRRKIDDGNDNDDDDDENDGECVVGENEVEREYTPRQSRAEREREKEKRRQLINDDDEESHQQQPPKMSPPAMISFFDSTLGTEEEPELEHKQEQEQEQEQKQNQNQEQEQSLKLKHKQIQEQSEKPNGEDVKRINKSTGFTRDTSFCDKLDVTELKWSLPFNTTPWGENNGKHTEADVNKEPLFYQDDDKFMKFCCKTPMSLGTVKTCLVRYLNEIIRTTSELQLSTTQYVKVLKRIEKDESDFFYSETKEIIIKCLLDLFSGSHTFRNAYDSLVTHAVDELKEIMKTRKESFKQQKENNSSNPETPVLAAYWSMELEEKMKSLKRRIEHKYRIEPLGQDRHNRIYWYSQNAPGQIFIEDTTNPTFRPPDDDEERSEIQDNEDADEQDIERKRRAACLASDFEINQKKYCYDYDTQISESTWFIFEKEKIQELIYCLNDFGIREKELKANLIKVSKGDSFPLLSTERLSVLEEEKSKCERKTKARMTALFETNLDQTIEEEYNKQQEQQMQSRLKDFHWSIRKKINILKKEVEKHDKDSMIQRKIATQTERLRLKKLNDLKAELMEDEEIDQSEVQDKQNDKDILQNNKDTKETDDNKSGNPDTEENTHTVDKKKLETADIEKENDKMNEDEETQFPEKKEENDTNKLKYNENEKEKESETSLDETKQLLLQQEEEKKSPQLEESKVDAEAKGRVELGKKNKRSNQQQLQQQQEKEIEKLELYFQISQSKEKRKLVNDLVNLVALEKKTLQKMIELNIQI